jgi:hypothetical protein
MNNHRISSSDLKTRITEHIQELAEATDAARVSEEMQQYLDMCARFHRYSPQNVWLILMTRRDATHVAGFKKWQSMGRHVKRGEHGIPILAPILKKVEDDEGEEVEKLIGFKVVYVFDISQTDGDPLPGPPDWKSPDKNAELTRLLMEFAQNKDITVKVEELPGEIQGASCGGKIILDPEAGTKTLIHEIAHELLHQVKDAPTESTIRELEAESVAYVVAKHFGLDGLSSPNYILLHKATAELILEHLERIRKSATEIINGIGNEK